MTTIRTAFLAASCIVLPAAALAQGEDVLKEQFEGKFVVVRMDLPATARGVDLRPGTAQSMHFAEYSKRIKDFGVAIRVGQRVMVTKVKLKDDLIEFQLAGGGFGTVGDDDGTGVSVPSIRPTKREAELNRLIKVETDMRHRKTLERERDELKQAREREDRRNEATASMASEQKKQNVRQQRLDGGSRFNIRYAKPMPSRVTTPDAVRAALAEYLDFGSASVASPPATTGGEVRLGMLLADVERLLGPAARADERPEGSLTVSVRTYDTPRGRVTVELVRGVVIGVMIR